MQSRGAIHVHWFAYINDAPVYGESSNENVADYYDKIISCSSDIPEEHKEYINYQIHRHSKYCCVGKLKHCRFSFPQPPMPYTCILEPFLAEDVENENERKQSWSCNHNYLENYGLGTNVTESFNDMLIQLDMTVVQYINGVCSSTSCPKFFPRNPCEIRINNYMHNSLHIWRANHDTQLSLSPHAMIEYILLYVTKGQKGMSIMMEHAHEDAKHGNYGSRRISPSYG